MRSLIYSVMGTLYNILLISTSAIGLYVSVVLFFFSKHNRLLNRLLAAFTLAITLIYALVLISKTHWGIDVVALIRTFLPIYLIVHPACFLYVRTFLQDDVNLNRKDLIHAIPFLLNLVYVTPLIYALLTGHVQWQELTGKIDDPTHFINYGPIPDVYHVVFRSAVGILYTVLSLRLYLGKKFHAFEALNKDTYPLAITWIKSFVVIIVCHSVFSLLTKTQVFFLNNPGIIYDGNWVSIGLLLTFNILFIYASFNPVILFGLPHFTRYLNPSEPSPQKVLHPQSFGILRIAQPTPETGGTATAPVRYEVSVAEPFTEPMVLFKQEEVTSVEEQTETTIEENEAILQLIERMERYMAEKQPFRQKEFNTFTISRDLDVPQHHIAYLFKYILKKSVVDYRNKWRVNYVIDCLKKGRQNQYTIETIGLDAGYNSKSTFFLDFKKHTGKTPLQYVEELGE